MTKSSFVAQVTFNYLFNTSQRLLNLRNVLNYQFTPKNNVFTMVNLFIVIIIPFFIIMISLTKEATFP